jgi:hypothetical protein
VNFIIGKITKYNYGDEIEDNIGVTCIQIFG